MATTLIRLREKLELQTTLSMFLLVLCILIVLFLHPCPTSGTKERDKSKKRKKEKGKRRKQNFSISWKSTGCVCIYPLIVTGLLLVGVERASFRTATGGHAQPLLDHRWRLAPHAARGARRAGPAGAAVLALASAHEGPRDPPGGRSRCSFFFLDSGLPRKPENKKPNINEWRSNVETFCEISESCC